MKNNIIKSEEPCPPLLCTYSVVTLFCLFAAPLVPCCCTHCSLFSSFVRCVKQEPPSEKPFSSALTVSGARNLEPLFLLFSCRYLGASLSGGVLRKPALCVKRSSTPHSRCGHRLTVPLIYDIAGCKDSRNACHGMLSLCDVAFRVQ